MSLATWPEPWGEWEALQRSPVLGEPVFQLSKPSLSLFFVSRAPPRFEAEENRHTWHSGQQSVSGISWGWGSDAKKAHGVSSLRIWKPSQGSSSAVRLPQTGCLAGKGRRKRGLKSQAFPTLAQLICTGRKTMRMAGNYSPGALRLLASVLPSLFGQGPAPLSLGTPSHENLCHSETSSSAGAAGCAVQLLVNGSCCQV